MENFYLYLNSSTSESNFNGFNENEILLRELPISFKIIKNYELKLTKVSLDKFLDNICLKNKLMLKYTKYYSFWQVHTL